MFALLFFAGWLIADLLSGFAHWLEDRVFSRNTPIIGRLIVSPNRLHHEVPMAFTLKGFWLRNWSCFLIASVGAGLWLWWAGPSWVLAGAFVGGALATQIHYCTHVRPKPGSFLRALQESGIIQSAPQHARHHKHGERRYCAVTDICNPILDHFKVWARLESVLLFLRLPISQGMR